METRGATLGVLACGAAVILSGCFHTHEPVDGGIHSGVSAEEVRAFLDARQRELCRRAIECEPRSDDDRVLGDHRIQYYCRSGLEPFVRSTPTTELMRWEAGTVRFDPEVAAQCLELLRAGRACFDVSLEDAFVSCFRAFEGVQPLGAPCDTAIDDCGANLHCDRDRCVCVASAPLGAPCGSGVDCLDALLCDGVCREPRGPGSPCTVDADCDADDASFCIDGACGPITALEVGDGCLGILEECGPDLACVDDVCVAPASFGEPCTEEHRCRDGLACVGSTCAELRAEGEPCTENHECSDDAPHCVRPEFPFPGRCSTDATGRWCRASTILWFFEYAPEACPDGYRCRSGLLGTSPPGGCQPIVAFGEPCADSALCPDGGRCADGVCRRVVDASEPCGEDVCPQSHVCRDGACVERPLEGEPCDASRPCIQSVCIDGVCARLPDGAACLVDSDCESGGCDYDLLSCVGAVGEGALCDSAPCLEGLYCAHEDPVRTCVDRCM